MQCFNPDLPTRLIESLPEQYRCIFYEEKYEWRDPPTGFFTKGGYLTIPSPDRLVPMWVQIPPSTNDPWDQMHTAFERFGMGGQMTNPASTRGTMGMAGTAMGGGTISGSASASQGTGGMAINPPPANNPFTGNPVRTNPSGAGGTGGGGLPGGGGPRVAQGAEVPWAAATIQRAVQEAIQWDHQEEEARQEEAHQVEEPHQDGVLRPSNQAEGTA
ncbi:hypothetical protein WOLCODRAFT_151893 [Wolfiporia cocos MD-104 SS10]|uniref:Uncharacterized protein n=1 Tax=Wolfiporia cocos (strain MD-104) TaxID=742152 RepID=A0A2H3JI49_WOLCO|nr:hypothetical protein WOLCODRAFT_151893 [Wolfiporia cocos MD-104 SS10]